jgi:hypothetical protein
MTGSDVMSLFGNRRTTEGSPQIEWVPIGTLRPNPRNGRTHSKKQLKHKTVWLYQSGDRR